MKLFCGGKLIFAADLYFLTNKVIIVELVLEFVAILYSEQR